MAIGTWFRTEYDVTPHVLDLPADVTSGRDPGVAIVDQVVRGTGIVGRVTGDFGAVALKVRGTGRPMRVSVVIHLDELATRWWADRVKPSRTTPELPRLVLLRAQGRVRGAALLARRQGWRRAGNSRITLGFDLTVEELDSDGLLVVELAEPPRPSWAEGRLSHRSALGVRIDKILVRPADEPVVTTAGPTGTNCDLAVVQAHDPREVRLDVSTAAPAPPLPRSPTNRWTRRKEARAGFKVLRAARRVAVRGVAEALPARAGGPLGVLAFDLLTGEAVGVEVLGRRGNGLDLRLPGTGDAPVLLGLDSARPTVSLRVRPRAGR